MNNIEQYKRRFYILMESTMGNVKHIISEQSAFERNLDRQYSTVQSAEKANKTSKDIFNSLKDLTNFLLEKLDFSSIIESSIPLHLRTLALYLMGRTSVLTESVLTQEEKNYLWDVATKYGVTRGFNYPLWKELGASNLPTAITPETIKSETQRLKNNPKSTELANPGLAGQFMYTLGAILPAGIKKVDKDTIVISDNYDFNAFDLPKDEVLKQFSDTAKMFWQGDASLYSVIRKIVALKETDGYKGYPISFTIKNPNVLETNNTASTTGEFKLQSNKQRRAGI